MGKKEYTYYYEDGTLIRSIESDITLDQNEFVISKTAVVTVFYSYDEDGKLIRKKVSPADADEYTLYFETLDNGTTVLKSKYSVIETVSHSKTDGFGRKVFDEINSPSGFASRQFTYHVGEITEQHQHNNKIKSTPTTSLVRDIQFSDGRTISYEYDEEERITKVTDSVDGVTEYTYDALGQLLTETVNGQVKATMTYDNYGNISSKNGVVYTYGDSAWKDLLTGVGTQTISYDAQGNPVSYLGHTLTWEKGRQLKSFDNISYTYNANGIRTSKTINGLTSKFILEGTKIVAEVCPENYVLQPMYDNEEDVCGIIYNGTPYYFLKNLQGDVIAITRPSGEVIARYTYDAWGVPTIAQDTEGIAAVNPFRYRSYYFDTETGLYYLQSRYYDASVGRFINGDNIRFLGVNGEILGHNLFSYCANNCVNKVELNGNAVAQVIMILVGALIGAASYLVGYFIEKTFINKKAKINWLAFTLAVAAGAIDGALSFAAIGKFAGSIISFLMEFIPSIAGGDGIIESFVCAALAAFISFFLSGSKMINFGKSKYYTYVLFKKLKSNKWSIIKKGIKTFFKKIYKHLKQFITNSSITALFSLSGHTSFKAAKAIKELKAAV